MTQTNFQKTIKKSVQYQGVGIFSGKPTTIKIFPAPPDNGIVFHRVDLPEKPKITATIENAYYKYRRTALKKDTVEIETVEHMMSAIYGLGIDNLVIEIDSNEIPVADGSSEHFVKLFLEAGVEEQNTTKRELTLTNSVEVKEADAFITATPTDSALEISYTLSYQQDYIGTQFFNLKLDGENYAKEISPARTFVLASEIDTFLKDGLGKGANTKNTLIVEPSYIRDNTLRFKNEFVRHKILDLIGDLALLGKPIKAHIIATKSGHNLNLAFVKKLAELESKTKTSVKYDTLLDVREILKILPHRYPLLLIDKVIEIDSYKRAVGIKNVTFNEPFFQGHFPNQPIMPGVLQVEAMAQLAGALLLRKAENQNKLAVLMSIDTVKFRRTVVPGDQLKIEATVLRLKARTGLVHTCATVDDKLVSEAYMKFIITDKE